jgi:hypothetical protein
MSYLVFTDAGKSPSGKTKRWGVGNTSGTVLGWISWYAPWRKYTFTPGPGMTFDSVCLSEISAFISNETRRHKDSA